MKNTKEYSPDSTNHACFFDQQNVQVERLPYGTGIPLGTEQVAHPELGIGGVYGTWGDPYDNNHLTGFIESRLERSLNEDELIDLAPLGFTWRHHIEDLGDQEHLGLEIEVGLMAFGDGDRALELMGEIRAGTALGRVLGNGAAMTGKVFSVERVPVVKNQAISAYDPRAIKGTGVTYATSPQGADHTCGMTIRAKITQTQPDGQVKVSREAQIKMAGDDSLGACIFASFGFADVPETISDLVNARHGTTFSEDILQELGLETLVYEREFNSLAGFTNADDRLPEWMTREALPPHNTVFDVPEEEMDHIFDLEAEHIYSRK